MSGYAFPNYDPNNKYQRTKVLSIGMPSTIMVPSAVTKDQFEVKIKVDLSKPNV